VVSFLAKDLSVKTAHTPNDGEKATLVTVEVQSADLLVPV